VAHVVKTSWWSELIASAVAVSGVGYVAASYTISRWLTRAVRARPPIPPLPSDMTWEALQCRTEDGLRLAGWALTPTGARATVALFHGLRANRSQLSERIEFLTRAGYRCVAFDHRAHGQSDGRRTSFGYHERQDVAAVLELIARRWPEQPRGILGISMGAAAVCYAAPHTHACQAVILESMYHNLAHAFRSRVGHGLPRWFGRFRAGVIWMTERRLGVRLAHLAPVNFIGQLAPSPVLLVTGGNDTYASPLHTEQLYARCMEPRELSIVAGAEHQDVCQVGGQEYQNRVLDFLQRHLR
jgi:alpha-beta hydrolase superfamily lysophospholipase